MKRLMIFVLALSLAACNADEAGPVGAEAGSARPTAGAEQPLPQAATKAAVPKAAIFLVGEDLTPPKTQALAASLAGLDGVLAAKPDPDAGTFVVTFAPGEVTPEALGQRLKSAASGVEFIGLTTPKDIPANHDDCGDCPYKDKCAGAK